MPKMAYFSNFIKNKWTIISIALLLAIFFLGGSSRADVYSLLILRPLTIAASFFFAAILTKEDWYRIRFILIFILSVFSVLLIQLIPLPPAIWQNLPGREIIIAADLAAGFQNVWRPVSLTPDRTINAVWAMFVPLSVLLSLAKVRSSSFRIIAISLAGMALASAILGVLQVTSGENSPLYFYRLISRGFAAGFFANRNHNAMFLGCAIPILFAISATGNSNPKMKKQIRIFSGLGIVFCLGLILAIGSRSGILIALLAIASLPILSSDASKLYRNIIAWVKIPLGRISIIFGSLISALLILLSLKTQSIDRLIKTDFTDTRIVYWKPILEMIDKYFPIGSGFGSFVEVYKIDEPLSTLESSYVNHAHNDLLEILMTGGIAGGILIALAMYSWCRSLLIFKSYNPTRDLLIFHRVGALILLILAVSSLTDYPLRTPFLGALAVVAAAWMQRPRSARNPTS